MKVYVVLVAPAMFVNVVPSMLDCHCTVGTGLPDAAALNEAALFRHTVAFTGSVVTVAGWFTVITALPDDVPVQRLSVTFVTV